MPQFAAAARDSDAIHLDDEIGSGLRVFERMDRGGLVHAGHERSDPGLPSPRAIPEAIGRRRIGGRNLAHAFVGHVDDPLVAASRGGEYSNRRRCPV